MSLSSLQSFSNTSHAGASATTDARAVSATPVSCGAPNRARSAVALHLISFSYIILLHFTGPPSPFGQRETPLGSARDDDVGWPLVGGGGGGAGMTPQTEQMIIPL
eukprot:5812223-Pyramimonas_sp.AAC.2